MESIKGYLDRPMTYMLSSDNYQGSEVVIFGIPMDFTTSYRPGARFGPQRVREVADALETYSPYLDRDLAEVTFYDAGDVEVHYGNVAASLDKARQVANRLFAAGKKPLMLGGEHLVSLPVIEAALEQYPDLVLLHFDAHADLREEYMGERLSHATVIKQAVGSLANPTRLYQFGIRSGEAQEFAWARKHSNFHPFDVLEPFLKVREELQDKPLYVSIDIDVVDPAFAPGTGTAEPGGCSSAEILTVIRHLRGLNVVGLDIVELAPDLDSSDITAFLVAKMVREAVLAISKDG